MAMLLAGRALTSLRTSARLAGGVRRRAQGRASRESQAEAEA